MGIFPKSRRDREVKAKSLPCPGASRKSGMPPEELAKKQEMRVDGLGFLIESRTSLAKAGKDSPESRVI